MATMRILRPFGASARCSTDKKLGGDRAEKKVTARCDVEKQRWDGFERFPDLILPWSAPSGDLHYRAFWPRNDGASQHTGHSRSHMLTLGLTASLIQP